MATILFVFFAFLVISAAGIYALFARDLSAARAHLIGQSEVIDTSFGKLEYALVGEGEPILISHGAGGGFDQGMDVTEGLAGCGYRLIVPSRFGYLASTLPANPTTAMQADAYAELLDRLGIKKASVLSISAGAWSALQFAIRHPDRCRAIALIAPAGYLPPGKRNYGGPLVRWIFGSDFVAWTAIKLTGFIPGAMAGMMLGTNPALVRAAESSEKERLQQILDRLLPVSARLEGTQFDIRTAATPEPLPIERIACPVLAISADDDMFGTAARAKYITAKVPDGRLFIYPSGGHALVGRLAEVLRQVASFFRG
jgi:2-hydroxy-6-oxonona-2,4-dienedioate hydrolase